MAMQLYSQATILIMLPKKAILRNMKLKEYLKPAA